jgi:hypothetical protein
LYHALFTGDVIDGHFPIFQRSHDFVVVENFVVAFDVRTKRHSGEWNLRESTNNQNFIAVTRSFHQLTSVTAIAVSDV